MVRVPLAGGYRPSDTVVFILGAGASAPYNLPVMAQFMSRARRNYQQLNSGSTMSAFHERMFSFWKRCRDASWAFIRHWDNIEELYTQADLLRLMGLPPDDNPEDGETSENLCEAISWCIWDVYRQFRNLPWWTSVANQVKEAGLRTAIVTTNYDLCVEASFLQSQNKWNYVYPGFENRTSSNLRKQLVGRDVMPGQGTAPNEVPVIKLHGSVNWFRNKQGEFIAVDDLVSPSDAKKPSGLLMNYDEVSGLIRNKLGAEWEQMSPAIIPPMLGKSSDSRVIQANWNAAVEAIGSARMVFVIGYSFPTTDAFMLRLLTEGMARNRDFEKLTIIDRSTREAWTDRINTMFEPMFQRQDLIYYGMNSIHAISTLSGHEMHRWHEKLKADTDRIGIA